MTQLMKNWTNCVLIAGVVICLSIAGITAVTSGSTPVTKANAEERREATPAAASVPREQLPASDSQDSVVVSIGGKKYHRPWCSYLRGLETKAIPLSQAVAEYPPCDRCKPPRKPHVVAKLPVPTPAPVEELRTAEVKEPEAKAPEVVVAEAPAVAPVAVQEAAAIPAFTPAVTVAPQPVLPPVVVQTPPEPAAAKKAKEPVKTTTKKTTTDCPCGNGSTEWSNYQSGPSYSGYRTYRRWGR